MSNPHEETEAKIEALEERMQVGVQERDQLMADIQAREQGNRPPRRAPPPAAGPIHQVPKLGHGNDRGVGDFAVHPPWTQARALQHSPQGGGLNQDLKYGRQPGV